MDQWWPLWVRPQFEPVLGEDAFKTLTETVAIDNPPNGRGDPNTGDAVCEQEKDLDPAVVLRRRPPAPDRRRLAAADPLDQPADVPTGRRDPAPAAPVSASASVPAATAVAGRAPTLRAGPASAAPSA